MPFILWKPPAWLDEPHARCPTHGLDVHWRCRTCNQNLCAQGSVAHDDGSRTCLTCGTIVVRPTLVVEPLPAPVRLVSTPVRDRGSRYDPTEWAGPSKRPRKTRKVTPKQAGF